MPPEKLNHDENTPDDNNSHWVPEPSPNYESRPGAQENHQPEENPLDDSHPPESLQLHTKITPSEERTWAMLAHLSVLLNLVTGFLGGVVAIIIYFGYKDRSKLVAYHAMQSFIFQTITWLGAGMLAGLFIGLGSAFAILILPLLCLIPGFLLLLLLPISLIYGVIGGVKVNNGEDFRYWQVGDWVRDILEPKPVP